MSACRIRGREDPYAGLEPGYVHQESSVPSAIAKCCGHRLLCAGTQPCIQQFEENRTDHGCYLLWKAAVRSVVRALVVLEGRPAMRVAKTLAQSRIEQAA